MFRTIATLAVIFGLAASVSSLFAQDGAAGAGASKQKPMKEDARMKESRLIVVLTSSGTQKEKADACRELSVVGTRESVAPLAALLGDEKLAHMARYGLEPIPDPAVDTALRDSASKLKGRLLVGVIGSIGVRRDPKAVPLLAEQLRDKDPEVAQASARALGRIGNVDAAKALEEAHASGPAANRLAIDEGLFRCAEALASQGQRDQALSLFERLKSGSTAPYVVKGASRAIADIGKK